MLCDKRTITYNLDLLYPGIYFWINNFGIKLGGKNVDESYPEFLIKENIGFGIVINNRLNWYSFKEIYEKHKIKC